MTRQDINRVALAALRVLAMAATIGVSIDAAWTTQRDADVGATARADTTPLLWRIEGPRPAYLFGTIHVPDARVLKLPPVVDAALEEAEAVYTEIPMDLDTQLALSDHVMLPSDQRLQDITGAALYERLSTTVQRALGEDAPRATGTLMTRLDRLKPWAALGQIALLDYLAEMAEGRQPLDAVLYTRAEADGKVVAGLETLEEQVGAFEAFTIDEQVAMLGVALDEWDAATRAGTSPARVLIDAYLAGDLDRLETLLSETPADPQLARKFEDVMIHQRNRRMAERIAAIRRRDASTVTFFAVGALHLAGQESVPALLTRDGFEVTRAE